MKKTLEVTSELAEGNIVIAIEDIINCFKKGVLLCKTTMFEEFSFTEGWVSIYAFSKNNKLILEYWLDDEILPDIPMEKVRVLTASELNSLKIKLDGNNKISYIEK